MGSLGSTRPRIPVWGICHEESSDLCLDAEDVLVGERRGSLEGRESRKGLGPSVRLKSMHGYIDLEIEIDEILIRCH